MFSEDMFANRAIFDNVWWRTGRVAPEFENAQSRLFLDEFYRSVTNFDVRRAMLLIGPRRVGKTWLLQHAIRKLLENKVVAPNHILFFPVDLDSLSDECRDSISIFLGTHHEQLVAYIQQRVLVRQRYVSLVESS